MFVWKSRNTRFQDELDGAIFLFHLSTQSSLFRFSLAHVRFYIDQLSFNMMSYCRRDFELLESFEIQQNNIEQ